MKAKHLVPALLLTLSLLSLGEDKPKETESEFRERIQKENKEQRREFDKAEIREDHRREHEAIVRRIRLLEAAQIKDRAKEKSKSKIAPSKTK